MQRKGHEEAINQAALRLSLTSRKGSVPSSYIESRLQLTTMQTLGPLCNMSWAPRSPGERLAFKNNHLKHRMHVRIHANEKRAITSGPKGLNSEIHRNSAGVCPDSCLSIQCIEAEAAGQTLEEISDLTQKAFGVPAAHLDRRWTFCIQKC